MANSFQARRLHSQFRLECARAGTRVLERDEVSDLGLGAVCEENLEKRTLSKKLCEKVLAEG